jgi:hypothetical protein
MRSARHGAVGSAAEVTNISPNGIWLLVEEREFFLSFEDFPWFRDASVRSVLNVERPHPHHLHWPDLDVDLHLDSLEHPERYPLVSDPRA